CIAYGGARLAGGPCLLCDGPCCCPTVPVLACCVPKPLHLGCDCTFTCMSSKAPSSLHELVLRVVLVQKKAGGGVLTQIVRRCIRIDPSDVGPSGFCVPCFA
ncbi:unnamed protein product, partial [Ectocarpus sp. 8 AP-2014]